MGPGCQNKTKPDVHSTVPVGSINHRYTILLLLPEVAIKIPSTLLRVPEYYQQLSLNNVSKYRTRPDPYTLSRCLLTRLASYVSLEEALGRGQHC
jgi:hypothetical protein